MIYLLIAATIFVGDMLIKNYIEKNKQLGKTEKILGNKIIVTKYHNQGAFLNFLEKQREILLLISGIMIGVVLVILLILMPQKGKQIVKAGAAFLLGGAASNVYDRVFRGYVVDYFSFSFLQKVVFNISDMFIFLGSIIVAVYVMIRD